MTLPQTKKENVRDIVNGIPISDPYRWLEKNDEDVLKWVDEQNQYTNAFLEQGVESNLFKDELVKNFQEISLSCPVAVNGAYFYTERKSGENQFVLYMKKGLRGDPVELVNPNKINASGTTAISSWNVSRTGKYVAYGIMNGDEITTVFIKDLSTYNDLSEVFENSFAGLRWLPDDSGFFYVKRPKPGTVPKEELRLNSKVYFHSLGNDPVSDPMIFGQDQAKDDGMGLALSQDGKYLAITVSNNWTKNDLYIYDTVESTATPLVVGISSNFAPIFLPDKLLIVTNYGADNKRVLYSELENIHKPIDVWKEFIAEKENALVGVYPTKNKILVEYLVNVCSEVAILDHDGNQIGDLPLPRFTKLQGISTRITEEEFFYDYVSFTFPKIIFRFNPEEEKFELYRKMSSQLNSEDYAIRQEWYESKDGTQVPMFIIHKKEIDKNGQNPTILYGYGGFKHIESPRYLKSWVSWLERGGIFVIANIRGGVEFGTKWHEQALKLNRQKSFDDFIAAAEFLIKAGYTSKERLGIHGGSNGGLLVSVVAEQRPELFKAVSASVPLTDMVRFHKSGMAMRWVHEYGNPDIKEELVSILKWSPYHNVVHKNYPSFLISTGENDTRVNPFHSRKLTAVLQEVSENKNVFLYTDKDSGHGAGKSVSKIVEGQAIILTFFCKLLDLKL